ncbi:hypothetical protein GALL_553320 [mine drainage metagenome]|uniref:Uncharacterized protein n=1 Tax=mine drainage metagenome TaxID=410659 RepID=A0A1J5NWJ6_9ZZZZ
MSADREILTQWAVWVGQRGLPLFFGLLALCITVIELVNGWQLR